MLLKIKALTPSIVLTFRSDNFEEKKLHKMQYTGRLQFSETVKLFL